MRYRCSKLRITNALNRSQARWDANTWAASLRSYFSPCVIALYAGVILLGDVLIGDKETIGFEVGINVDGSESLKEIEIWVAGTRITERDNIGCLPHLSAMAFDDANRKRDFERFSTFFAGRDALEIHQFILWSRIGDIEFKCSDDMFYEHQILDWGSNTDDAICFLVEVGGRYFITLEYVTRENRKKTVAVQIELEQFRSTLLELSGVLKTT